MKSRFVRLAALAGVTALMGVGGVATNPETAAAAKDKVVEFECSVSWWGGATNCGSVDAHITAHWRHVSVRYVAGKPKWVRVSIRDPQGDEKLDSGQMTKHQIREGDIPGRAKFKPIVWVSGQAALSNRIVRISVRLHRT